MGPILKTLVFSTTAEQTREWVDSICSDWNFTSVIPAVSGWLGGWVRSGVRGEDRGLGLRAGAATEWSGGVTVRVYRSTNRQYTLSAHCQPLLAAAAPLLFHCCSTSRRRCAPPLLTCVLPSLSFTSHS